MWASYIQLGTAGPALTCAARDSSPHTIDRYVEHSSVHPMDRGCHEIFAALVFLLQSVRLSVVHNSRCFIMTGFSLSFVNVELIV